MKHIFLIAAVFALPSTAALAQIDTAGLIAGYEADGYTDIALSEGQYQTRLAATHNGSRVQVVYDTQTGVVLTSGNGDGDDGMQPGVSGQPPGHKSHESDDDNGDDDSESHGGGTADGSQDGGTDGDTGGDGNHSGGDQGGDHDGNDGHDAD